MDQARTAAGAEPLGKRAARRLDQPLTRALLVLTFTTGLIDGVSYLGLGHVFAANMTGNIVLLGFGIAGSGGLPVISPLVSLCAFLIGAGMGGALALRYKQRHPAHIARALGIETVLVLSAAVLAIAVNIQPNALSGDAMVAVLALGMGVRNSTVRSIAAPDLTTTVLTMTLTGLAADSMLFGGKGTGTIRRSAAVIAMLTGAIAGALLLKSSLFLPLLAAGSLSLATWLVYVPAAKAATEDRNRRQVT